MGSLYQFPIFPTKTAEDFMAVIAAAEEKRYLRAGTRLPKKSRWQRALLEIPFNLAGQAIAQLLEFLPRAAAFAFYERLFSSLASPRSYPFDPASPALAAARELVRQVEAEGGRRPALLALISHPPVVGELAHMNFELVRHASLALRELRAAPCRPRLVVAVDPFALDTVSMPVEGLYAGCMGSYHIGIDRMCFERGRASRAILRGSAWPRTIFRVLRELRGGGAVGMVLAGGVAATTRVLYAGKEWLASQRAQSRLRSAPLQVLRALRESGDFARFFSTAPKNPSVWRLMERYLAAALSGELEEGENPSADTGRLGAAARRAAEDCARALGFAPGQTRLALDLLAEELARETPYRARFFRVLAGRLERPLVILPVAHRVNGSLGVEVRPAWAWTEFRGGEISARSSAAGAWQGSPEAFAARFVKENFE